MAGGGQGRAGPSSASGGEIFKMRRKEEEYARRKGGRLGNKTPSIEFEGKGGRAEEYLSGHERTITAWAGGWHLGKGSYLVKVVSVRRKEKKVERYKHGQPGLCHTRSRDSRESGMVQPYLGRVKSQYQRTRSKRLRLVRTKEGQRE